MAGSVNASGSSLSNEQTIQTVPGPPMKQRKRHKRKHFQNQRTMFDERRVFQKHEIASCHKKLTRNKYIWELSVRKKRPFICTIAAFMCGREPNLELSKEEKKELIRFKWDEFLAMTRQALSRKKPTSHWKSTKQPI